MIMSSTEPTGIATRRVSLMGFKEPERLRVQAELASHGWTTSTFMPGTDLLVAGPDTTPAARSAATGGGMQVVAWEELVRQLRRGSILPPIAIEGDTLRLLDIHLPRKAPMDGPVPEAERFAALCHDLSLLRAVHSVAMAAKARIPAMLEGPTATAKSTAVLWVAHLLGQPVLRLNLNGHADSGDLVGRFVPDTSGEASWRFLEGAIPLAMRRGWWVLLDEVNLAEPQIIERLNPVLERPPSLLLSEHDLTRFGVGGVPIADGFRIFATMNPAEYAGRSVLSPAFRDRWALWTQVGPPSGSDVRALVDRLVLGRQPLISHRDRLYQSPTTEPILPHLAAQDGIEEWCERIARVHISAVTASGSDGDAAEMGRVRRERYTFSRRTLLTALELAESAVAEGRPLQQALVQAMHDVYCARLSEASERAAMDSMLRAAGLA